MTVKSGEITRTMGVPNTYLHRWERAGLISPILPGMRGGARGSRASVWPDWTWRMVAVLRRPGSHAPSTLDGRHAWWGMLRKVALVLAEHPDVPWVVIDDDGVARACYTACEVVAIHRHRTCTTVVAIPTLEEACS